LAGLLTQAGHFSLVLKGLHRRTHRGQARAPESNLQRELPAAARVHRGLRLDWPAPLPSARLLHRSRPFESSGPRVILAVVLMEGRVQILPPFGAPGNRPPARKSPFAGITSPNFDSIPLASDQRSLVCHSSSLLVHATLVFLCPLCIVRPFVFIPFQAGANTAQSFMASSNPPVVGQFEARGNLSCRKRRIPGMSAGR
jgi:hypothetical protein